MHFLRFLFTSLVTVQVYYMYKFIYSIPLKYEIPETENEYLDIGTFLRGIRSDRILSKSAKKSSVFQKVTHNPHINHTYHETHTQKHLRRPHQEQTISDNSTALTYIPSTSLDVADRF